MAYTTIDDPTIYFNTLLYTGNSTARSLTGVGFQPDWVWIKSRSNTYHHELYDVVRGVQKGLNSNRTDLEETRSGLTSFDSDGFSIGTAGRENNNGDTQVAWNWKAGTSFTNDASATGVGTIDSSGSTNQTAGFSIVSWTGTGSAGTIAHNLGSVPEWYLLKVRSGATNNWGVYHHKSNANPEQYALYLDSTSAATDDSGLANDTAPTSTVFSVTSGNYGNANGYTYIGYFFSEVKGYSKFGSYTGNGNANGPYVHVGFKPAFVITKKISGTSPWGIHDNKRDPFNEVDELLEADSNAALSDSTYGRDYLSNGFKIRTSSSGVNGSGDTFVYMAFAENPFVNSNGVPNNAR
jgi:hypothetical protein